MDRPVLAGTPAIDRRRAPRRSPDAEDPLSRVRLRTGRELTVLDVSNTGALVEGTARLLPGTHVDVHIVTREGRVLVRSRVTRAYVSHVASEQIQYRGALAFERPVDTSSAGYAIPEVLTAGPGAPGSRYPDSADTAAVVVDERLSA